MSTALLSNHFRYMLATKKIDFENDVFKIILMTSSFEFGPDDHATLSDVTASQLSTGYGYTQNNKELAGVSVTESDALDKCIIMWADPTWTADSGDIGPTIAAIIYDDTTSDKTVVGCITGDASVTAEAGKNMSVKNIAIWL